MSTSQCGHGAPALPLSEALQRIAARVRPVNDTESVSSRDALGRISAAQICSKVAVPGYDNAAMDGYAFDGAHGDTTSPQTFNIVGSAFAGHPFTNTLGTGDCVRIMTGAPMPPGADTVVMQEAATIEGTTLLFDGPVPRGEHVRRRGEDVARGATVVPAGCRLEPAHLGVLASIGISTVPVLRRPRVALLSTGDELREVGAPLADGQVYDSNRENLFGLLTRSGAEVIDLGLVEDNPSELGRRLLEAAQGADAIITSGGASVGEADHMTSLLARLGTIDFASVAIKPGRPTLFGELAGTLFFGLPGNPVSVSVTYYQLVQPALRKLCGASVDEPRIVLTARSRKALNTRRGRTEFQRGILTYDEREGFVVDSAGGQGSGILSSMVRANCFIVVTDDKGAVSAGDEVEVTPFECFV